MDVSISTPRKQTVCALQEEWSCGVDSVLNFFQKSFGVAWPAEPVAWRSRFASRFA